MNNPYPYYQPQQMGPLPHYPQSEMAAHQHVKKPLYPHLKPHVFHAINPFVQYGLKEAQTTSYQHALQEVAAIAYLMGKGFDPHTAYLTVESWEMNEKFY